MLSVRFIELLIVALMGLVGLTIPTARLVVTVLIYRKLQGIEEALDRGE